MTSDIATLWHSRSLIGLLTLSKLRRTHRRTLLGHLWWLLDPIAMTAVYTVVVGFIRGRGALHEPYPAFVMCGLVAWKSFASTQIQAIKAIGDSRGLVKSFAFPKAAIPISLVLSNQVLFAFALIAPVLLCLFYQVVAGSPTARVGWTLAYVPLVMLTQLTLTFGTALLLSCFGAFFRDLGNIMTHVLRMMYYLSPGLYAISDVVKGYEGFLSADWSDVRSLYLLNPLAHVMKGYRDAILYGHVPDFAGLGYALAVGVLMLVAGLMVFRSQEHKFAKCV